jgi:hypothetical protein
MTITCANCSAQNPDGKKFCGDCGAPLAKALGPETVALRAEIRAVLKDELFDQKVVEVETTEAILGRLTAWGRIFAYFAALPAAILIAILVVLGIKSYADFLARVDEAKADVTRQIGDLNKQAKTVDALREGTETLRGRYSELLQRIKSTNELADQVDTLKGKVDSLERLAVCDSPHKDIALRLTPGLVQFQQYMWGLGYRSADKAAVRLCVEDDPSTGGVHYSTYYADGTMHFAPKFAKPSFVNREYMHIVLPAAAAEQPDLRSNAAWPVAALQEGLAYYFPCSFADDSKAMGDDDLARKRGISEIPHNVLRALYDPVEAWGNIAWDIRSHIGKTKADPSAGRGVNQRCGVRRSRRRPRRDGRQRHHPARLLGSRDQPLILPAHQGLFALSHAFDCVSTTSSRLPITRFMSIRCRPQFACTWPPITTSPMMSSARGSFGSAFTVTAR